ncbi:calcyphosin-like protein [Trichonephila clavipes]|nr:calcyphosin-like protein [Trichonephila clavipes]
MRGGSGADNDKPGYRSCSTYHGSTCSLIVDVSVSESTEENGRVLLAFNIIIRALHLPKISPNRLALIEKAFEKADKSCDGKITYEDLKGIYSVQRHPEYLNGQATEKQLLNRFLKNFEENGVVDGVVTKEEFLDYYTGVSASIDEDGYFDLMMRTSWKL